MRAGNYYNGAQYVGILFLTFWILLSYLVPLSLFVTMEIVKFVLVSAACAHACPSPANHETNCAHATQSAGCSLAPAPNIRRFWFLRCGTAAATVPFGALQA